MENARRIWERLGLPRLTPQPPWHGYDLGFWPHELEQQARMATESDYFTLGANLANERRSDVAMNTPVGRTGMKEK
jgi:4-hydroxy-3-polyprenylbenzoate decarboxylase